MKTFIREGTGIPVLCLSEEKEMLHIDGPCIFVSGMDWNRDLSPWPAQRVFSRGQDFAGRADDFLKEIMPLAEKAEQPLIIAGYSLAGLFALYASAREELFAGCASVSGSLWYPGFSDWLKEHPVHARAVYLSLGDREKNTSSPLMKTVEERTEEISRMISCYADTVFEMNPGGHFQDPERRLEKGIARLREMLG